MMSRRFGKQNLPRDPRELLCNKMEIDKATNCWNWTGSLRWDGYGQFQAVALTGKRAGMPASRASWMIHRGDIPAGMLVCHHCDNRRCVNPDHLFLGTPRDNSQDMVAKNRSYQGRRHWKAKLDEAKVVQIRQLRSQGLKIRVIAERYGVTTSAIDGVLSGANWRAAGNS